MSRRQGRSTGNDTNTFSNLTVRSPIKGVGATYSGVYYVTHVTHTFTPNGYTQTFRAKRNALRPTGSRTSERDSGPRAQAVIGRSVELETIVADLLQKVERRFYGKYRGFVVNAADPRHLGRLRVRVPSVLGPDVVTGWAMPCVPYGGQANQGFLCVPEVGAGVWVEFEEGDREFPIWVGTFWSEPGGKSEIPALTESNGQERPNDQPQPTRKIIKTRKGHTIQFEDADGKEMIVIS